MIVKDEAHVIKETLENIYKYIDYYVINDTGSTDGTQKIIKEFFDSKGIKGEIIDHEFRTCKCHGPEYKKYSFFHFGWNRSYALDLCKGKSEYIWVFDADDLVVGDLKIPELKADSYMLTYGKGFTYQRVQIFKNDPSYRWKYMEALHEYPTCDKKNFTKAQITGNYYVDSRRLGARNKDSQKYLRDAKVFEELLLENPDNERNAFYCAQSYFDYRDFPNAIKWYKKRVEMGRWFEEVFYSLYRIAQAMEELKYPWKDIEEAYMKAHTFCKIRAEPLYNIAKHYRLAGDFQTGYKISKKASYIPYPEKCVLFIYRDMYEYRILDEVAVNAFYLGKYHESYSISKKLLDSGVVPESEIKRIKSNMDSSEVKLHEKEKKICCIYAGDEIVNKDSPLMAALPNIMKTYKIILIGNKVDVYKVNDITVASVNSFKSLGKPLNVDYLILYNNLNFFYDNMNIKSNYTILMQNDNIFKLVMDNGFYIAILNHDYLNPLFANINKITCIDQKIKSRIANDYKTNPDQIFEFNPEYESYEMFDNVKYQYKFKLPIDNDTNGLYYFEPNYVKHLRENISVYDYAKPLILDIYKSIVNKFPTYPEHLYKLASIYNDFGDHGEERTQLDNALTLIKKSKIPNNQFKDVIMMSQAKLLYKTEKYRESYDLADEILKKDTLPESIRQKCEEIRDLNVDHIKDSLLYYNKTHINNLDVNLKTKTTKKILLSITTCKRFDLFEKTINSFLNCCNDSNLIDTWLCVDDNSSQEDRNKMKKQYPFFEYIFKNESQKGHYVSMNIIRDYAIKNGYEYILHMEDDWHFVQKRNYIGESLKLLAEDPKYGQALFNNHYSEVELFKHPIAGGILKRTKDGTRYYVHEYYPTNTKEYQEFIKKHSGVGTCGYWPHFSFRPSVLRVSMLMDVGSYYNTGHFEMQYANEYVAKGYKSVFFDTFCCIHIGKKTWESNGINSYNLNKTGQFSISDDTLMINILSNNNDSALWKSFKENARDKLPYYIRQNPKDVTNFNDFEKRIFMNNEFNYLRSHINQIMRHLELFRNNKSKYVMILKENINLVDNFTVLFNNLMTQLKTTEYEFISFDITENNDHSELNIIKKDYKPSLESSFGYIISDTGMKKILAYVVGKGIKNMNYLTNIQNLNTYVLNQQLYTVTHTLNNQNNDFKVLEGYKFYSQMDSFGDDIGYFHNKTVDELKEICDKEGGKCFNTLGYVKHNVTEESKFIYLPSSTKSCEGLYVKL
jgi:tetratricopeptide (TPR) repeat protein